MEKSRRDVISVALSNSVLFFKSRRDAISVAWSMEIERFFKSRRDAISVAKSNSILVLWKNPVGM